MFTFVMAVQRGAGDSKTPFKFLLAAVLLDAGLNPLLIFGFGPVRGFGIAGSALATLLAYTLCAVALIRHLYRIRHPLCLRGPDLRFFRVDRKIFTALLKQGLPMGLQVLTLTASTVAIVSMINRFGADTAAAYGAAMQLWEYVQMPGFAIACAVSSMVARNIGARRWEGVSAIVRCGVLLQVAITAAFALGILALDHKALGLFLSPGVALETAVHINRTCIAAFVFLGTSTVLFAAVRAAGAVVADLLASVLVLWGIRVPLAAGFIPRFGVDALWLSYLFASMFAALIAIGYYRVGHWRR
jgi:putative MATE family efflux protein